MQNSVSTTSGASRPGDSGVGAMFDRIAPTYDLLNHLLSLGRDGAWRRRAAGQLRLSTAAHVLDLATGTGDLLIALLRKHPDITEAVGLDVSEAMLQIARKKIEAFRWSGRVRFIRGDAMQTSLAAGEFDAVTMGFGIRNTPDAHRTLSEIHRVLKPGGTALILEFSWPKAAFFRAGYLAYLRWAVPLIGRLVSRDKQAYRYLNTSIEAFHRPDEFCSLMEQAGFASVSATPVTWGVASIYTGSKTQVAEVA